MCETGELSRNGFLKITGAAILRGHHDVIVLYTCATFTTLRSCRFYESESTASVFLVVAQTVMLSVEWDPCTAPVLLHGNRCVLFYQVVDEKPSCWNYRGWGTGIEVYSKRLIYSKLPKICILACIQRNTTKVLLAKSFIVLHCFRLLRWKESLKLNFSEFDNFEKIESLGKSLSYDLFSNINVLKIDQLLVTICQGMFSE